MLHTTRVAADGFQIIVFQESDGLSVIRIRTGGVTSRDAIKVPHAQPDWKSPSSKLKLGLHEEQPGVHALACLFFAANSYELRKTLGRPWVGAEFADFDGTEGRFAKPDQRCHIDAEVAGRV
jgi:hypothetical protein